MADHSAKNLVALYEGIYPPDDPSGWNGGWRAKHFGEDFNAKISFDYMGDGGYLDVGLGLDDKDSSGNGTWAVAPIYVSPNWSNWTNYSITVHGIWDGSNLDFNDRVSTIKVLVPRYSQMYLFGGPTHIEDDGDNEVYYQETTSHHDPDILDYEAETFYDGFSTPDRLALFPDGKMPKFNGDTFTAKFPFNYRGPGGRLKVGVGIDHSPTASWAIGYIDVSYSVEYKKYSTPVLSGIFDSGERAYDYMNVQKCVQTENGQLYIDGSNMLDADVDKEVYCSASREHEVDIIDDPTRTFYDGKALSSSGFPLPKLNGDTFTVKFPFIYRGPGGRIKFAAGLDYSPEPTYAVAIYNVPTTPDWTEYWSPVLSGTFYTSEDFGDQITVVKIITSENAGLDLDGHPSPYLPVANSDIDVYYRTRESDMHEADIPDNTAYYRRNQEPWVFQDPAPLIGMRNGDNWSAKFTFKHKGEAGQIVAGVFLKYLPAYLTIDKVVPVTRDLDWKDYTVEVSGIWDTTEDPDTRVDVIKFVNTVDDKELDHNDDVAVFYHMEGIAPPCGPSNPCPENYECKDGKCVYVDPGGDGGITDWLSKYYLYLGAGGMLIAGGILLTTGKRKKK